ncbi:MAG: hypothetical protein WC517_00630 [Patescibacteria group bacterium]
MNKTIIIGGATIVIAGAIATGSLLNNQRQDNPFNIPAGEDDSAGNAQKIEDLYFEGLEDKDRYTFCLGKEEIKGVYTNAVFGNEKGNVEYISEDISVFDKESNKLYILGRKIDYKYSGNANLAIQSGDGSLEITESGVTTEYYKKNSAPIRIDYNSKIINPAPDRENTDWVAIKIKSRGTLMGLTQERVDEETGDAKVFCSNFSLAGQLLKNGAFITPDFFSFEKACPDYSPNPGVSFSGNFKFECQNIENKRGIELVKEYQEIEKLREEFKAINESGEDDDPGAEFREIIPESDSDDSDIQNKLQQLRDEMKAEATAHD